ncbi:MAG: M20/M25/M40 family metallo-hydrolase [Nitrospinota bacterium]|nr:MAG: M20/M25/M40 family metallo-hydrolase [Nitrospinota bacterium]
MEKILPLLQHILSLRPPQDPFLGEGILVLTDIISSPYPGASVIPQECRVTFDRRLLVGETEESILAPLQQIIRDQQQQDSQLQAEVSLAEGVLTRPDGTRERVKKFAPAWVIEEAHPLVQAAKQGLATLGLPPVVSRYSFCTNGSYSAGVAGIPTIGFGPSCEGRAHTIDEYVEREQLEMACQGYQAIAKAFLLT